MNKLEDQLDKMKQELRRGVITLATLSQLDEAKYGYALVTQLKDKGFPIEANTLYPLLRRLEKQGLLKSSWDTTEARPRKYYYLSDSGKVVLKLLTEDWSEITNNLQTLLKGEEDGNN